MLNKINNWIKNRALHLSAKTSQSVAKSLGTSPEKVQVLTSAIADVVIEKGDDALIKALTGELK